MYTDPEPDGTYRVYVPIYDDERQVRTVLAAFGWEVDRAESDCVEGDDGDFAWTDLYIRPMTVLEMPTL